MDLVSISQSNMGVGTSGFNPASAWQSQFSDGSASAKDNSIALSQQDLQQLQQLKHRELEVRTHEQAHLSTAGQYAKGGASFTLKKGPDSHSYATGGEVSIDIGKEKIPETTISKMRIIKQAALAPANPSSTDRRIASQASVKEAQAKQEISMKRQEELLQSERQSQPAAPEAKGKSPGFSLPTFFNVHNNLL